MTSGERVWDLVPDEGTNAEARGKEEVRKSDFADGAKSAENKDFSRSSLGQCYPQQYPQAQAITTQPMATQSATPKAAKVDADPLGEPMTIGQVAELLACSAWTVRQRYLPSGLPYFRIGTTGKLLFYRKQVVQWILQKQNQGRR
jgi:hypothetical protein